MTGRRRLALLALAPVAALAGWSVLDLWREGEAERARLETRLELLGRAAASVPALAEQASALEAGRAGDLRFAAASPALAEARLQEILKQAVAEAGGTLRSTQGVAAEAGVVTVRALFSADHHGLRHVLLAVENARPALRVERLEARGSGRAGEADPILDLVLEVSGLMGGNP